MRIHRRATRWQFGVVPALVVAACITVPARADESYYMMVYAAQRSPKDARYTHTFATFVRATGNESDNATREIEQHTISWIAASKEVVLARVRPETGVNLDLRDSLRLAAALEERVTMWGPFEIRKPLYDRALKRIEQLESGRMQYKAIDFRFRPESAINCIHAVTDLDADKGLLDTGGACGEEAGRIVMEHLRRWIIAPDTTHDWLAERLGLDESVVVRRSWNR
jgi:hypothetical protein